MQCSSVNTEYFFKYQNILAAPRPSDGSLRVLEHVKHFGRAALIQDIFQACDETSDAESQPFPKGCGSKTNNYKLCSYQAKIV